jgi:hypothetical protein
VLDGDLVGGMLIHEPCILGVSVYTELPDLMVSIAVSWSQCCPGTACALFFHVVSSLLKEILENVLKQVMTASLSNNH